MRGRSERERHTERHRETQREREREREQGLERKGSNENGFRSARSFVGGAKGAARRTDPDPDQAQVQKHKVLLISIQARQKAKGDGMQIRTKLATDSVLHVHLGRNAAESNGTERKEMTRNKKGIKKNNKKIKLRKMRNENFLKAIPLSPKKKKL